VKILLKKIMFDSDPIRSEQSEEGLTVLAASLHRYGQINPVRVRPVLEKPGFYKLIYGYRRVEAAYRLGWTTIEATVDKVGDEQALMLSLIENMVREEMNPLDIAKAIKRLMVITRLSARELARRGLMSKSRISQFLGLLDDPEPVQRAIQSGDLSERQARALRRVIKDVGVHLVDSEGDNKVISKGGHNVAREKIANKVIDEGLTAKEIKTLGKNLQEAEDDIAKDKLLEDNFTVRIVDDVAKWGVGWLDMLCDLSELAGKDELSQDDVIIVNSWLDRIDDTTKKLRRELGK
jgi:ParB family chromosome partitioning protein